MITTISTAENIETSLSSYILQMCSKSCDRNNIFFINPSSTDDLANSLKLPIFADKKATLNLILKNTPEAKILEIFDFIGVKKTNYITAGMTEKEYYLLQRENKLRIVEVVKPVGSKKYNLYSIVQYLKWKNNKNYFNELKSRFEWISSGREVNDLEARKDFEKPFYCEFEETHEMTQYDKENIERWKQLKQIRENQLQKISEEKKWKK